MRPGVPRHDVGPGDVLTPGMRERHDARVTGHDTILLSVIVSGWSRYAFHPRPGSRRNFKQISRFERRSSDNRPWPDYQNPQSLLRPGRHRRAFGPLAQAGAGNQPATKLPATPAPTTNIAESIRQIVVLGLCVFGMASSLRFEASASPAV